MKIHYDLLNAMLRNCILCVKQGKLSDFDFQRPKESSYIAIILEDDASSVPSLQHYPHGSPSALCGAARPRE